MTRSEDDLDSLLQTWTTPACPPALDKRLRLAYRDRNVPSRAWRRWFSPAIGMFAGVATAITACLFVVVQAFPQALAGSAGNIAPFVVDTAEIEYRADGSSAVVAYRKETGEPRMVLSSEFPGDPLRTAEQRIVDPLILIRLRIMRLYWDRREGTLEAQSPLRAKMIADQLRDCTLGTPWTVAGHATILSYLTTGIRKVWTEDGKPVRYTEWSAPALRCFTLKTTTEKTIDGQYRLASERRALKVTPTR